MPSTDSLKSIMDAIENFKDKHFKFKKPNGSYLDRSSISKATKDIIASFPVICSDTISPPVASMVAKATERNCVVMLQLLFSSAYLKGSSGREVLSKWHTNMDNDMNMDDFLDIMDTFAEDTKVLSDREYNVIIREMSSLIQENITSANKVYPLSSFSESSINNYIVTENYKGDTRVILTEKEYFKKHNLDIYDPNVPGAGIPNPDRIVYGYDAGQLDPNAVANPFGDTDMMKAANDYNRNELERIKINTQNAKDYDNTVYERNYKQALYDLQVQTANVSAEQRDKQIENQARSLDIQERDVANREAYQKKSLEIQEIKNADERAHKQAMLDLEWAKKHDRVDQFLMTHQLNIDKFSYEKEHDKEMSDFEREKFKHQKKKDKRADKLAQDKFELEKLKFKHQQNQEKIANDREAYRQLQADMRDTTDFFHKQLLSTDVKKYNELVPSLLVVRFQAVDPDDNGGINSYRVDSQCVIGVKTRLIPVDSFDIINHMRSIEKSKLSLLNLVRATTKEISFCKDFIAANRSTFTRLRRKANDAGAITTLVVSIEEVNALKKEYDIDLTNPKKAKSMMEAYNLLSFVIVDEQVEVVRFLYDGEKYFQDYAFSMLERETGDNSYKKVVNLISKLNRG